MPALPAQPFVLKVDHHFTLGEDLNAQVRWHWLYSGTAPSNTSCGTIAGDLYAFWVTYMAPYMANTNSITQIEVTDLSTPTSGIGSHVASTAGGRAGPYLPADACVLQNAIIARRYRGGKPRSYWPLGVAGDLLDAQTWLAASLVNFESAVQSYVGNGNTILVAGCQLVTPVSISYYSGFTAVTNPITGRTRDVPKVRSAAISPDTILSFPINHKVGTQRRRTLIRG